MDKIEITLERIKYVGLPDYDYAIICIDKDYDIYHARCTGYTKTLQGDKIYRIFFGQKITTTVTAQHKVTIGFLCGSITFFARPSVSAYRVWINGEEHGPFLISQLTPIEIAHTDNKWTLTRPRPVEVIPLRKPLMIDRSKTESLDLVAQLCEPLRYSKATVQLEEVQYRDTYCLTCIDKEPENVEGQIHCREWNLLERLEGKPIAELHFNLQSGPFDTHPMGRTIQKIEMKPLKPIVTDLTGEITLKLKITPEGPPALRRL